MRVAENPKMLQKPKFLFNCWTLPMSAISCASRDADASKATLEMGPLSSELTLKLETLVSPVLFSARIAFIVSQACSREGKREAKVEADEKGRGPKKRGCGGESTELRTACSCT